MIVVMIIAFFIAIFFIYKFCNQKEQSCDYGYEEGWYGKEKPCKVEDTSIQPFSINVSDEVLKDLNLRLERTRFEVPLEDPNFLYGFNSLYLKTLTEYWRKEYDWRKQERELNKYSHFKTSIEGLNIHFMHIKPTLPEGNTIKIIPLMIIHGWPGCFFEFMKIIPFLTSVKPDQSFVFEVICPSIPGYGFSDSPSRKGLTARATARIFITLMKRIGHSRFYVQGGDWGSIIASIMARFYPQNILGLHVNMYVFSPQGLEKVSAVLIYLFPFLINEVEYKLIFPLKKLLKLVFREFGYFLMQSTKPDTLGCAMADSPAGMAAYLLEKFSAGTNEEFLKLSDGGLTEKFTLDELITNVMVYWVNNNFTSAARFYKENISESIKQKYARKPVIVPSAVAFFPNEPLMMPKLMMLNQMKNLVSYTIMPKGGHFAAMEEPELLAGDIWKFVSFVEKK